MDVSETGRIVNGPASYAGIAEAMRKHSTVEFIWLPGDGNYLAVVFSVVRAIILPSGRVDEVTDGIYVGIRTHGYVRLSMLDSVDPDLIKQHFPRLTEETVMSVKNLIDGVRAAYRRAESEPPPFRFEETDDGMPRLIIPEVFS